MNEIRHRWAAAAYTPEGQNWVKLFQGEDHVHNGALDYFEFRSLIRRVLKITAKELHEDEVQRLFR